MRVLMTEDSNDAESSAFLLDDNSRWKEKPFQMCLHNVLLFFHDELEYWPHPDLFLLGTAFPSR